MELTGSGRWGLNPCSNGSTILGVVAKYNDNWYIPVLILVLMEVLFWDTNVDKNDGFVVVLILVLMEVLFWVILLMHLCLISQKVLILVLMEVLFWA